MRTSRLDGKTSGVFRGESAGGVPKIKVFELKIGDLRRF